MERNAVLGLVRRSADNFDSVFKKINLALKLWRACNLTAFIHSSTGQGFTCLLPIMMDRGSTPRGVLMWNRDSPVSVVLLHWWPRCDWSLWPPLRRALSQTVTRLLCSKCDYPTWYHPTLLSQFHACCRSSFRLHSRHSRLLGGGEPVESLQSHCIHTQFHWSSGPPVCFASKEPWFNPQGGTNVKPGFSC